MCIRDRDSEELKSLLNEYDEMYKKTIDVPMIIGGNEVTTQEKINIYPPHDINHCVGHYYLGNEKHVEEAIEAALQAKVKWSRMKWQDRASIFLKAADLLTGPFRDKLNAATMIGQSKNVHQAEIDAACELIDFLKFNVKFMTEIYENQPISDNGMWNRMEYRPLEGFIFALTPFNFTSICANLCAAPALMGNVIVWKPARTQIYSAKVIMDLFKEAGLPDGVINMITVDGSSAGDVIFKNKNFAGLHFTGSTNVFNKFWEMIGKNIDNYISYPRIVGETGGKDFIVAHKSCEVKELNTAIIRGSFEFQGQKCSASSRVYVPKSKWKKLKEILINEYEIKKINLGLLDITFFRDDFGRKNKILSPNKTSIEFTIEGKSVILIDDVLYTGRSVTAALAAIQSFGRPKKVELLSLVDRRFSRHLPIQPDYYGIKVDSINNQRVEVKWDKKNKIIFVHGASRRNKEYPLDYWKKLADHLNNFNIDICIPVHGENQINYFNEISKTNSRAFKLETDNFHEIKEEFDKCSFFIGVDTGLTHICAGLGLSGIFLFGPTDPSKVGPVFEHQRVIKKSEMTEINPSLIIEMLKEESFD